MAPLRALIRSWRHGRISLSSSLLGGRDYEALDSFLLSDGALVAASRVAETDPAVDSTHWIDWTLMCTSLFPTQQFPVTGWKITVDENISMYVIAWNLGPLGDQFN